ncbi:MAG: hypothetical protein AAF804_18750, partial [Bacteroidota bacterium]
VEASLLLGGRKGHHLESGLGTSFIWETNLLGNSGRSRDLANLILARLGYRYQPRAGGFFFKVGFTPNVRAISILSLPPPSWDWFLIEVKPYPHLGIGAGWTLKN